VPIVGGITLVSFLMNRKWKPYRRKFTFANIHIWGLLFIIWIFVSNPQAAWFAKDINWVFTFFQLWVFIILAGELLDAPEKHHILMWVYAIVTMLSALVAIQQGGQFESGIDINIRATGLAEGANTAARYFVIATVFFVYLRSITQKSLPRLLALFGGLVTFGAVFMTVSRSGIVLLFVAAGLLFLLYPSRKNRLQLVVIFLFATVFLIYLSQNIIDIINSIVPAISQGTDTVGLRYSLWKAGWRMWLDHMISGVGIGRYRMELRNYGKDLIPAQWLGLSAHSMYVALLAETGFVGLGIFLALLVTSLKNLWDALKKADIKNNISLPGVWFVVLCVIALGGITKTDQADKMLWLVMGISIQLASQTEIEIMKRATETVQKKIMNNSRVPMVK
jgi:O-antigen ligase